MSADEARPDQSGGPGAYAWSPQQAAELEELVAGPPQDATAAELGLELELHAAREDLRLAEQEVRLQREQLEELLQQSRASTSQRRRIASLLPVPMVSLDPGGRIVDANAAAADLVHVPLVHLIGKPLVSFVQDSDRALVQLAMVRATGDLARVQVHLTPRRPSPVPVDLLLTVGSTGGSAPLVECTLLPAAQVDDPADGIDPVRLAAAVTEISRLPVGDPDVRRLLAGIARTTATALGDGVWVSVNLGHPAEPSQLASSAEEAAVMDGLQIRTGEGPCIEAFEEQLTVFVDDLLAQHRWPRLRAVWGEAAASSVLGVPVVASGEKVGCLNCYSAAVGAFTDAQARAAEVLALAGGAALEAARETARLREVAAQLDQAMTSRAVIDQAKGIVMARRGGTADEAFAHLAALSQQRNIKLRDLARALVEQTGTSTGR